MATMKRKDILEYGHIVSEKLNKLMKDTPIYELQGDSRDSYNRLTGKLEAIRRILMNEKVRRSL